MSTKIEWTDETWNPVTGCSKVSQGCKNCYAERDWSRLSANPKTIYAGRKFTDVQCHPERLEQPLRWTKPRRIFVNSMSDLFHESVSELFIHSVFSAMAKAKQHQFQILTKRPERMVTILNNWQNWLSEGFTSNGMELPLPNVWLGVSVEDQATADERIPLLLKTPAAIRWVSAEPLLGPIDFKFTNGLVNGYDAMDYLVDWVVVGGESGPNARPMHPDWARSLSDQCKAAGVPFLFKQWGEYVPAKSEPCRFHTAPTHRFHIMDSDNGDIEMCRIGKKAAGRLLDGELYDEYPKVIL